MSQRSVSSWLVPGFLLHKALFPEDLSYETSCLDANVKNNCIIDQKSNVSSPNHPAVGGARFIRLIRRFIKRSIFRGQLWPLLSTTTTHPPPPRILSACWIPGLCQQEACELDENLVPLSLEFPFHLITRSVLGPLCMHGSELNLLCASSCKTVAIL